MYSILEAIQKVAGVVLFKKSPLQLKETIQLSLEIMQIIESYG